VDDYPRPVYVRWLDHWTAAAGWTHRDDIEDEGLELETVAYLIDETEGCYLLSSTPNGEGDLSMTPMAILKVCVLEIVDLAARRKPFRETEHLSAI